MENEEWKELFEMSVNDIYLPHERKVADIQYRQSLATILAYGEKVLSTPQGVPAITYIGLSPMVFKMKNGVPLVTERAIPFWKSAIGEICGFINGVTKEEVLEREFSCSWWKPWVTEEKAREIGFEPGDLGPASYGGAFHSFPYPPEPFNQISHAINQLKKYPYVRTVHITPWIPYWIGRGGFQRAAVSPCHGWMFFRVINARLWMQMHQRSADFPVGVPANMIQYAALLLMFGHVTGYTPDTFVHSFFDTHIYEDQIPRMQEMIRRTPRRLPSLFLTEEGLAITDIFDFRPKHFELRDYNPHPAIKDIPVAV